MKKNISYFQFELDDLEIFKAKVLQYASNCNTFSYYDNNQYQIKPNRYELLVGIGIHKKLNFTEISTTEDWIFGQFDFELFPQGVGTRPFHQDPNPNKYFIYIPQIVIGIEINSNIFFIDSNTIDAIEIYDTILQSPSIQDWHLKRSTRIIEHICKESYIANVISIQKDIYEGNYYELNYCIPFKIPIGKIDPISLFLHQNRLNPSPMASCVRQEGTFILSTSPERFLYKEKDTIISQPIKGTAPKIDQSNNYDDIIHSLKNNPKERAENVMIVDLTRNDLAKCCKIGSIQVTELFGIYEFPFVFQMISTIQGTLKEKYTFANIIKECYPMGSMSGAPKKSVLDHLKKYEPNIRGKYSGTLFYQNPQKDFDSNVVIRSLIYDTENEELSYHVGSAITYDSIPAQEWEELQWKSISMKSSFDY